MLTKDEEMAIENWGGSNDHLLKEAMKHVKANWKNDAKLMALIATLMHRIDRLENHTNIPLRNAAQYDKIDQAISKRATDSE